MLLLSMGYLIAASALALYALHAYGILAVLIRYFSASCTKNLSLEKVGRDILERDGIWPDVVTQLPLYNEANVAARVMRAAAAMEYPGRHLIQVLDDSDDETAAVVNAVAEDLRRDGHQIEVIRRVDRSGFKAGALAFGMSCDDAPFLAIFDADFVPPTDFLTRTVPIFFADQKAGFVQGRWTFFNGNDSILTRAQGVGLDSHFAIEQAARSSHPTMFMNFNGTAGIWRRSAIEDAGGWSSSTLTEDLDLSYRVQLQGWRGHYLNDLPVAGELPTTFSAYKSQQFRWAKGSMQTAIRLLPRIFHSEMSLIAKVEAFFHLTHYVVHPLLMILVLLAPILATAGGGLALPGSAGWILLVAAFAPTFFYAVGQGRLHRNWLLRLANLPTLTLAGMGLAATNARAIAEACLGHESAFIRTPKKGDQETRCYRVKFPVPPLFELALGFYSVAGVWFAWQAGHPGIAQFGLLAAASFFYMGSFSFCEEITASSTKTPASNLLPKCALILLCLSLAPVEVNAAELPVKTDFLTADYFDQGKAEVNIYDATLMKYGQPREATVTQIWVKEPWDAKQGIKWGGQGSGDFDVIKLNHVVSYPTGMYRYEQMWSGFWKRGSAELLKFSLSHHEACGNTFKQARLSNNTAEYVHFSYFENEGDGREELLISPGAIFYDELPLKLRLLANTGLEESVTMPLFPTVIHPKAGPMKPSPATIRQVRRDNREVEFEVKHAGGIDTFVYETKTPFKLLRWNFPDGGKLSLRKSLFTDYWNKNQPGDERLLETTRVPSE